MLREELPRPRESLITRLIHIASELVAADGAADDDAVEECQEASDGVLVKGETSEVEGLAQSPRRRAHAWRRAGEGDLGPRTEAVVPTAQSKARCILGQSLLRPKLMARPPAWPPHFEQWSDAGQAGGQFLTQWSSAAQLGDSEHPPHGAVGSWNNAAGQDPEDLGDQERRPMTRTQHRKRQRIAQKNRRLQDQRADLQHRTTEGLTWQGRGCSGQPATGPEYMCA